MTKKQEIEEIDKLIRSKFHGGIAYKICMSKYGGFDGYSPVSTTEIAEAIYNAGYRKEKEK